MSNRTPEFQLVMNVLLQDSEKGKMQLHPNFVGEFESVEELRLQLMRADLRQHAKLYHYLCLGMESGRMRGTEKRPPCPLEQILTISHEAMFRYELALSISAQSYRHGYNKEAVAKKAAEFEAFCWVVKEERELYAVSAWDVRQSYLMENGLLVQSDDEDEPDDDPSGEVTIDEALF
jgi:hypothetical protein